MRDGVEKDFSILTESRCRFNYAIDLDNNTFNAYADGNNITKIGYVTSINNTTSLDDGTQTTTLICRINTSTPKPTTSDFIFFAKDNKVNLTSLLGYYALVKFKNLSGTKAEMFSAACEINESSK